MLRSDEFSERAAPDVFGKHRSGVDVRQQFHLVVSLVDVPERLPELLADCWDGRVPNPSATSTSESEMVFGVVCLMDALGFRGIWHRNQPREIVDTMRAIKSELDNWFELVNSFRVQHQQTPPAWSAGDTTRFHAHFVSDSVILAGTCALPLDAATRTFGERILARELVLNILQAAGRVSWTALRRHPKLLYRGCIASGRTLIDDPFILGEAVDEAAEWKEEADAAIVWLSPSAEAVFRASHELDSNDRLSVIETNVPLKGGRQLRTVASIPVNSEHVHDHAKRLLEAFASDPARPPPADVMVKLQNTAAFVAECEAQIEARLRAQAEFRKRIGGQGVALRPLSQQLETPPVPSAAAAERPGAKSSRSELRTSLAGGGECTSGRPKGDDRQRGKRRR